MPDPEAASRARRLSPGWKVLFALLLPVIFIALSELFLGLFSLERFDREFMPRSSFPVFVLDSKRSPEEYVTSPHFTGHLNLQTFSREKQPGVTRIFVVGDSAAYAWPYTEEYGFSGYLRRALGKAYPGRFEIVNAAGMSYGSHRVLDVLKDVILHEPDLVIIYSGNNEFVERNLLPAVEERRGLPAMVGRVRDVLARLNTYRALRLALFRLSPATFRPKIREDITDIRVDPSVSRGSAKRDPALDLEVTRNYRSNLAAMKELLLVNGIKGIFCTVPTNLSGWTPTLGDPLFTDPAAASRWQELRGRLNQPASSTTPAGDQRIEILTKMQEMAPDNSYVTYKLGVALAGRGQFALAYPQLLRAKDLDERPVRALSAFNAIIRGQADENSIQVADLEGVFAGIFKGGNTNNLFIDYCHYTEDSHRVVAMSLLPGIYRALGGSIDLKEVVDLIYKDDWRLRPKEDRLRAGALYAAGLTLLNNRQYDRAREVFNQVVEIMPLGGAYGNLGQICLSMGNKTEARQNFIKSLTIDPTGQGALIGLGNAYLSDQDLAKAAEMFKRAIKLNEFAPAAYLGLGDIAVQKNDDSEAVTNYEKALRYGADGLDFRKKLGLARLAAGDRKGALASWQAALKFDLTNQEIRGLLAKSAGSNEGANGAITTQ